MKTAELGLLLPRFVLAHDVPTDEPCWNWSGAKTPRGYGKVAIHRRTAFVHRVMFHLMVDSDFPIWRPEGGLDIDHLCRRTPCGNPAHLRTATTRENTIAGLAGEMGDFASAHIGVTFCALGGSGKPRRKPWRATRQGQFLGYFATEAEAAEAMGQN